MAFWIISNQMFNDDGGEATSTAVAPPETSVNIGSDTIFHARLVIQNQAAGVDTLTGSVWQFENLTAASGILPITLSSSMIRAVPTGNLIDGSDTTQRTGTGVFITPNSWVSDTGGALPDLTMGASEECECLLSFEAVGADVTQWDAINITVSAALGASPIDFTITPINPPRPPATRRVLVRR